ncbi:MAG TPA: nitrite/sulfite reductase [Bryobacteraceae bacterium]
MTTTSHAWKEKLAGQIAPDLAAELDAFENEIALKRQGKIDDKVFAETRLRRGAYGQRYDNGQRHDGVETRQLVYPESSLTKGPNTLWDAPGMQRIKIPFGGLNAAQLEVLAELAEEYSDGIAHVTTRQDIQLHFIRFEDTPALMRRLAAVGITTREACGNSVRNVTACPLSGVCREEAFDVTPHAKALAYFLLGHPDAQDFGRKFKVAFSGCDANPCGLVRIHDLGCIARIQNVDGQPKRGFEIYVGGGLGTVPYVAKLYTAFLPEEDLLPLAQAISRVFGRLGEKKNRNTARLKFLVAKLGLDEFKRLVEAERAILPYDPRWTAHLPNLDRQTETPGPQHLTQIAPSEPEDFREWKKSNVYAQRQPGFATITLTLPLGDITADQLRVVADLARKYANENVRTTVEQNLVLRWVNEADLPSLYNELKPPALHQSGAGTILDLVSCPGTDTCKLGISSSRGLAGELRLRLAENDVAREEAIRNLRIKVSGCFNSCGQHHIADLGFYGVSRKKNGYAAPHFQVVLGGQWTENAGSYGLAIGAVPSKRIPETVDRITKRYLAERQNAESFQTFIRRIGKAACKQMLDDLMVMPSHSEDASLYTDWHDPREYTIGDMGVGECAGEVVTPLEFQLTASEREAFEAQLALEKGDVAAAAMLAYGAMLRAATALLASSKAFYLNTPDGVVEAFRREFYDTQLFFDPFAGGKFAQYFFRAHDHATDLHTSESAHRLIEEAQLFIEAAHSCTLKLSAQPVHA